MTITTLWPFSPDVVQVVLAIVGIGSLIAGWIAGRAGRVSARRWIVVGTLSLTVLLAYSLIVTWLFATTPAGT